MVAVGDHERRLDASQRPRELVPALDAPEPGAHALERHLEVGRPRGSLGRRTVVKEEERGELRPDGAKEGEASLLRPGGGSLVRENDARRVRLEPDAPDDAETRSGRALVVRERLLEDPSGRHRLANEDAPLRPLVKEAARLPRFGGADEANDVERACGGEHVVLLPRDHVVRGSDEGLERSHDARVVAKSAKRLHEGHPR